MYLPQLFMHTFLIAAYTRTDALLCYSCTDVKDNENCFNITVCPDGEACFGRADGFQTAEVKHTTGCTKELMPPRKNGTSGYTFCSQTCKEDFCNLHTCQLGNKTRPPRCQSCDFVDSPTDCKSIVECKTNEVCFAEKVTTFQKIKYRLGCVNEKECEVHPVSLQALVGKRTSVNTCSVCCKSDHCSKYACSPNPTGKVFQLKPISPGAQCVDSDAALCTTLGRFNVDACGETSVVKACPKSCVVCNHVGWNHWQPWSSCSKTCDTGTRTRSRDCIRRFSFASQPCAGPRSETVDCLLKHCTVDGNWCYTTKCQHVYNTYSTCTKTRTTCDCPTPRYGGVCHD